MKTVGGVPSSARVGFFIAIWGMHRHHHGHHQRCHHQKYPIGLLLKKEFDGECTNPGIYEGRLQSFDPSTGFYKIMYSDGDTEDLDDTDINTLIQNPPVERDTPDTAASGRHHLHKL